MKLMPWSRCIVALLLLKHTVSSDPTDTPPSSQVFSLNNWQVNLLYLSQKNWSLCATSPSGLSSLSIDESSIKVSAVNVSVYEGDGNFQFNFSERAEFSGASLLGMQRVKQNGTLNFWGVFDEGSGGCAWLLTLFSPDDSSDHVGFSLGINGSCSEVDVALFFAPLPPLYEEHLFGLGTQYSFFELQNSTVPVWASEQGVGRGLQPITSIVDAMDRGSGGSRNTTYTQIPAIFSSAGRGFTLSSQEYSEWTFGPPGSGFSLKALAHVITGRVWGMKIGGLTKSSASYMSFISGIQPPLPEWVSRGAIVGFEGGTEAVLASLERLTSVEPDCKIAGVWIQDWTGGVNYTEGLPRYGVYWNWLGVNQSTYPFWVDGLLPTILALGARPLVYVNPHLAEGKLFEEAVSRDALVRLPSGSLFTTYGGKAMVNLLDPDTSTWFSNVLVASLLSANVSGFMADFGEAYPVADLSETHKHGTYPSVWASVAASIAGRLCKDSLHFMRTASPQSPRHVPLFWLGDQLTSWDAQDGLASLPRALLSAALSGLGVTHFDVGGYTSLSLRNDTPPLCARTKEMFMRSAEFAAFTWAFRTHPGSDPSINWQLDSDAQTTKHFFDMARLFSNLAPYRAQVFAELLSSGTPVFLPTAALFPQAPWWLDVQFFLGSRLLVAPVLHPGVQTVDVWLPRGTWTHVLTNRTWVGEDAFVTLPAPIGTPVGLWLG